MGDLQGGLQPPWALSSLLELHFFNTIIRMEAGHLRENSKKHFKQSPDAAKG
jgi:hypothetical protein